MRLSPKIHCIQLLVHILREHCVAVRAVKMQLILFIVSGIALLYVNSSVLAAGKIIVIILNPRDLYRPMVNATTIYILGGSQSDNCTNGFMSQERMDVLLHNDSVGHIIVLTNTIAQGIFPGMNFTCNGNIQSLIFGAKWIDGSSSMNQSFPELQIWRLRETKSYIKVRSALIKVSRKNTSQLYWYNLTSPLAFEAGDILGYYQPDISTCQLALYMEHQVEEGHPAYFYGINASSHLNVSDSRTPIHSVQLFLDVTVITGK